MSQRLAPEASEDRFRKFSAELLAAEEVGFRDGFFYSPDALSKILERFCNIIAENLHVQSCTVQLKLYDSANSPLLRQLLDSSGKVLQDEELAKPPNAASDDALWQSFSAQCRKRYRQVVGDESRSTIDQIKFRQELLKEAMIFPYALYPKGALWLVASNRKGPWARCSPWLISDINRGIMTQIIQDKAARVRDRMSLRQTRSHRKLGPMDRYIWTNRPSEDQPSPLYFFNYYGVPIRIHQRGDVIGILKVENKGLGAIKEESLTASNAVIHEELATVLKIQLGDTIDIDGFADRLLEDFRACRDRIIDDEEFVPQDISLFSVVYLAHDLAATEHSSDQTIGNFCTLSYPPSGAGDSSAGKRPPVQITFDNSEKEKVFIDWLAQTSDSRFKVVKKFYSSLKAALTELKASKVADEIQVALQATIADMTGVNIPADQLSLARIRTTPLFGSSRCS